MPIYVKNKGSNGRNDKGSAYQGGQYNENQEGEKGNPDQGQENLNSGEPLLTKKTIGKLAASSSAVAAISYGTNKFMNRTPRKTREENNGKNNENKNKFNLANEGLSDLEDNESTDGTGPNT